MPAFEMTPEEANRYGATLNLWQQLMLIQAWAPLWTFGQQFVNATDPYAKSLVVSECLEWLASKTDATLDDELVRRLADVLKTKEGEAFVRWVIARVEGLKA